MHNASAARDEPRICPFLYAVTADGALGAPVRWPDEANRCTALGDVAPQSIRQQEYACLASAHLNCPRYLRGVNLIAASQPATSGSGLTPAIIAALLVLAASFALSVGFVVANGGMGLPVAPTGSPQAVVASVVPSAAAPPAASVEPTGAASVGPSAEASVEAATAAPSIAPTPTPTPTPTPAATPSPRPSSDRYALLKPCPDAPECWIYTVRSGDNLVSIARYFGVPFEVVTELNPWTETTQLVAGQELRLPPPTR
jgi:LysM repeat protein